MRYELAFFGCGNMGGTLLAAAAKTVDGKKIAAIDPDKTKTAHFAALCGAAEENALSAAKECRFFVIGVKPQMYEPALSPLFSVLSGREGLTAITMGAGVSIEAVKKLTGCDSVIRIMPNTPAAVGKGVILYCADGVDEETVAAFTRDFAAAGDLVPVKETEIDAASALTGCGPAFCYLFIEALADAAVECGIPRAKALRFAAETVEGSAAMAKEFGNPAALKDAVCSPGGTTIAGVHALEQGAFRATTMNAVVAAYQKTLALKK